MTAQKKPQTSSKCFVRQLNFISLFGGFITLLPFGLLFHKIFRYLFSVKPTVRPLDYGLKVIASRLNEAQLDKNYMKNKIFLEIAPGENFSGPIAAVILGASKGIGIDAFDYTKFDYNLLIAEDLFAKIPLSNAKQINILRDLNVFSKDTPSSLFSYYAPYLSSDISKNSVDIIMSLSTMEHVLKPEQLYKNCFDWLKPGGIMIHKIDFSSHGMTRDWFGHHFLPEIIFKMMNGKKPSRINKWTEEAHIETCKSLGFQLQRKISHIGAEPPPEPYSELPLAATHIWTKKKA